MSYLAWAGLFFVWSQRNPPGLLLSVRYLESPYGCCPRHPPSYNFFILHSYFHYCRSFQGSHQAEANFHFGALGYLNLRGPSGRFATTDIMQSSTARARHIHWTSCSNSKINDLILNSLDIRNKNSHNEINEKGCGEVSDHTHVTYLWSTSLTTCNLKNGFRRVFPHIIRNNKQFSMPWKENAHRHSLQSFALILLA